MLLSFVNCCGLSHRLQRAAYISHAVLRRLPMGDVITFQRQLCYLNGYVDCCPLVDARISVRDVSVQLCTLVSCDLLTLVNVRTDDVRNSFVPDCLPAIETIAYN